MTRKQRRSLFIIVCVAVLGTAVGLVLYGLRDSVVFFYTPIEAKAKNIGVDQRFRLGGMVKEGSIVKGEGTQVSFVVVDPVEPDTVIKVVYSDLLPDLFKDGQGVIAEGKLNGSGVFVADSVLAKHDENYMPRELVDKMKKDGTWQGQE